MDDPKAVIQEATRIAEEARAKYDAVLDEPVRAKDLAFVQYCEELGPAFALREKLTDKYRDLALSIFRAKNPGVAGDRGFSAHPHGDGIEVLLVNERKWVTCIISWEELLENEGVDPELVRLRYLVKGVVASKKKAYEEHVRVKQEAEASIARSWKTYREAEGVADKALDPLRERFTPTLGRLFEEEGYPQEHLVDGWISVSNKGLVVTRETCDWRYKYEFTWGELYQAEKEAKK